MNKKTSLISILCAFLIFPILVFGQNTEPINPETPESNVAEINFEKIVDSIENINQASTDLSNKIREEINSSINEIIIEIRSRQDIQAYILHRSIDEARTNTFLSLENYLRDKTIVDLEVINNLEIIINDSLESIEQGLMSVSNTEVNLDSARNSIESHLREFKAVFEINREVIIENDGELLFMDSDGDGISDFEEIYIYNTDPLNPNTAGGSLTDGEKVALGLNPTSETGEPKRYEDPREDVVAHVSNVYKVESIQVREDETIEISGTAMPNSHVTIYIFSTPIIVTVKTDNRGKWTYTLDKELEDGDHEIYVATVDNSGKILARSEGNIFTKSAGAVTLSSLAGIDSADRNRTGSYLQENYILIVSIILLIGFIITISLFGKKPNEPELFEDDRNSENRE